MWPEPWTSRVPDVDPFLQGQGELGMFPIPVISWLEPAFRSKRSQLGPCLKIEVAQARVRSRFRTLSLTAFCLLEPFLTRI